PVIGEVEIGAGNSKQVKAGEELHIDALIRAEAAIEAIGLEIHKEVGSYEFEKWFTDEKYLGKRQVNFHEDVLIPSNAPEGVYHLHLSVEDRQGRVVEFETEITIVN